MGLGLGPVNACMYGASTDDIVTQSLLYIFWFSPFIILPVVIYTILGIPLAFWGWYLAIYDSAATESTLGYIKFFICFLIHIGFCIYAAIAPQISTSSWSFAGWMTAFQALNVT